MFKSMSTRRSQDRPVTSTRHHQHQGLTCMDHLYPIRHRLSCLSTTKYASVDNVLIRFPHQNDWKPMPQKTFPPRVAVNYKHTHGPRHLVQPYILRCPYASKQTSPTSSGPLYRGRGTIHPQNTLLPPLLSRGVKRKQKRGCIMTCSFFISDGISWKKKRCH